VTFIGSVRWLLRQCSGYKGIIDKMAEDKVTYKEPSLIKSFTAGGVGGVALVCTGHPLDTIKVIR